MKSHPSHAKNQAILLFNYRSIKGLFVLRAVFAMATKEHGLTPVVTKAVSLEPRNVTTLSIVGLDTRFKVLCV